MFRYRAISFPLLLGIFAAMIFWQPWGRGLFFLLAVPAVYFATKELLEMLEKLGVPGWKQTGAALAAAGMLCYGAWECRDLTGFTIPPATMAACLPLVLLGILFTLLLARNHATVLTGAVGTLGGMALLLPLIFPIAGIYCGTGGGRNLLFLVLATKAMDTGGYIAGMSTHKLLPGGNHKIVPSISPGKSYEGTAGGLLLSLLVGWLLWRGGLSPFAGMTTTLGAAFLLAWGSFAGDLTESAMKRACNIKDSGHLLPGMGGVLDVLDSFLYNGYLFAFLLAAFPQQ
ncbi:MAG: phosphatidate cytidylyltransferase [Victivallaceae bacterium]|nr:phosphatidate cytidylyltransferase [Victivallaceae bacterium]